MERRRDILYGSVAGNTTPQTNNRLNLETINLNNPNPKITLNVTDKSTLREITPAETGPIDFGKGDNRFSQPPSSNTHSLPCYYDENLKPIAQPKTIPRKDMNQGIVKENPQSINQLSTNSGFGAVIKLDEKELRARESAFSNAAEQLSNAWSDITNNQISKIQSSWAGADSQAYTDKIVSSDPKVKAAIDTLKLLSSTFGSAANELHQTQSEVMKNINR